MMNPNIEHMVSNAMIELHNSKHRGLLKSAESGDFIIPLVDNKGQGYILIDHTMKLSEVMDDYGVYVELGKSLYKDILIGDVSCYDN